MPIVQQVYELVSEEFPFCNNSFSNYMMDISIDENSVFWCGHYQQKVGVYYESFQNQVLAANQVYYDRIVELCGKDLYRKIVQQDLQFVGSDEMYKEKTVMKFICQANQILNNSGLPSIQISVQTKYKQLQEQIQRSNGKLGIPMFVQEFQSNFYLMDYQQHQDHSILIKPSPNNGTIDTNDTYKLDPELDSYMEEEKNYPFAQEDDEESFMQDQSKQMSESSGQEPFQPPSSSAFPQWVL